MTDEAHPFALSGAERFAALIVKREAWLSMRVRRYARRNGYLRYTPIQPSVWVTSVRGLSKPLVSAMVSGQEIQDIHVSDCGGDPIDPVGEFAVAEARRHRARGAPLGYFFGLMKYFRRSYQDLARFSGFPAADRAALDALLVRYFDRIEIAFCSEWASQEEGEKLRESQAAALDLANAKQRYLAIFDNLSEPVFVFDHQHRLEAMNAAARAFLDVEAAYQIDGLKSEALSVIERLKTENQPEAMIETRCGRRNVIIHRQPILDAGGRSQGMLAILNDVTERREASRRQKELDQFLQRIRYLEALGSLAGGLAHELNNLLQPIVGMGSSMRRGFAADSREAQRLTIIVDAARRAGGLVNDLLHFSRADNQGPRPVNPREEIERAILAVGHRLPAGVTIDAAGLADVAPLMLPPGNLTHVVLNLAANGVEAMKGRGGVLRVALEPLTAEDLRCLAADVADGVAVVIADDGVGMTPDVLDRCVEPFFTTKPAGAGTGLGLAVAQGIVTGAGGAMLFASEPGAGVTVRVLLPRRAADDAGQPPPV